MWQLEYARQELNKFLDNWEPRFILNNWLPIERAIDNWWIAYKKWEAQDTFNVAYQDSRMSVRTFGADFDYQKSKTIKPHQEGDSYSMQVQPGRFFADSNHKVLDIDDRKKHSDILHKTEESKKYHAQRGIDSAAFALPSNFATREQKYQMGLHDLSASLVNPKLSIFNQIHNNEDGAHFAFLALSKEEDQEVIWRLTRYAKDKVTFPRLYPMVRQYRAEMTRVKVAQEFDMGIGYTAVPVRHLHENEARGDRPEYKLSYSLTGRMTIPGGNALGVPVTDKMILERKTAARKFKSILGKRDAKNEIVIALRQHAGPFPVYAVRNVDVLECFDIVDGQKRLNGRKITSMGTMT